MDFQYPNQNDNLDYQIWRRSEIYISGTVDRSQQTLNDLLNQKFPSAAVQLDLDLRLNKQQLSLLSNVAIH